MKPKTLALILMAAVSFASPFAESLATGQVETLSTFGLIETGVSLVLLFWWYHLDKAERGYAAGRLMNAGVLVVAAIALPIYFIRSRGWRRGGRATGMAAVFLLGCFLLGELGERLGGWMR